MGTAEHLLPPSWLPQAQQLLCKTLQVLAATHWELELDFKIPSKPNHFVVLIPSLFSQGQHKHQGPITAGAASSAHKQELHRL